MLGDAEFVAASAAAATENRSAAYRTHAGAEAHRTLALDLADSAWVMHVSTLVSKYRPDTKPDARSEHSNEIIGKRQPQQPGTNKLALWLLSGR